MGQTAKKLKKKREENKSKTDPVSGQSVRLKLERLPSDEEVDELRVNLKEWLSHSAVRRAADTKAAIARVPVQNYVIDFGERESDKEAKTEEAKLVFGGYTIRNCLIHRINEDRLNQEVIKWLQDKGFKQALQKTQVIDLRALFELVLEGKVPSEILRKCVDKKSWYTLRYWETSKDTCPECNGIVSKSDPFCKHCGRKTS